MSKYYMFNDIKDKIKQQFIHNGWITVYKNLDDVEMIDSGAIYCALIDKSIMETVIK